MKSNRKQGIDWKHLRKEHKLTLLCLSISKAGNYRADVMDEDGRHYHHWLSPDEVRKLNASGFLKEHKPLASEDLYHDGNMERIFKGEVIV